MPLQLGEFYEPPKCRERFGTGQLSIVQLEQLDRDGRGAGHPRSSLV